MRYSTYIGNGCDKPVYKQGRKHSFTEYIKILLVVNNVQYNAAIFVILLYFLLVFSLIPQFSDLLLILIR